MSRLWLLVEWADEIIFSSYAIVSADCVVSNENDVYIGKTVLIREKHGHGARRAQILRISDNKKQVKELKILMERQDQQVKKVVSLCVNTIKEMKTFPGNLIQEGSSGRQLVQNPTSRRSQQVNMDTDETTDTDKETDDFVFNKSAIKQTSQYKNAETSVTMNDRRCNNCGSTESIITRASISDQYNKKNIKRTCDKTTQIESCHEYPPSEVIQGMENTLQQLYIQFLGLISQLPTDDAISMLSDTSQWDQTLPNNLSTELSIMKGKWLNRNVSTPSPEMKDVLVADRLRVRRASAHTTNNGETDKQTPNNNTEMVSIGTGNVLVPRKLLEDLDWTSYTSATRHLLQAIFPRRVLATHSLSGKQSPAFSNKPPKKRLDPKVVDDIVQTVSVRCGVDKRLVRCSKYKINEKDLVSSTRNSPSCITTKCTDEAKLYKNRQQFKLMRQLCEDQENSLMSESSNTS